MNPVESLRVFCKDDEAFVNLLRYLQENTNDSARNFEKILQLSPDSILITSRVEGRILYANPAILRHGKYQAEDLLGKTIAELWPVPANIQRFQRALVRYGRVDKLEMMLRDKDGLERAVTVSATPTRYQGENCLLIIAHDISHVLQTHERLQAVEARYKAIVETQAELICRYLPDTTLVFVNEAYRNYMGAANQDVLGCSFLQFLDESQIHFAQAHIKRLLNEKQRITHEMRVQNGPMQGRWIQWTDTPILNADSEVVEIQAVGRDISQRKEDEIALQEREAQLNLILDNVNNVILAVFDREMCYTVVRGQLLQQMGYDVSRMLGQPVYAGTPENMRTLVIEHMQAVLDGQVRELEYPIGERHISLHSYPLRTAEGVIGGVSMISDITERKKAEQKEFELAVERQRVTILSQFVRDAAHEFYTPLSTIETTLHLAERSQDEARRKRAYEKIRVQTHRLANLVDGMTTMMRLSTDNTGARGPIDFPLMFDLLLDSQKQEIAFKNLQVVCNIPTSLPVYNGVFADLRGAFRHILENAVRHSPDNAPINILVEATDHAILLHIHNEGETIPEEELGRIFEMFYRRDSAHSTPGLGLGLSIARAIIERQHSGHIFAENTPSGITIHVRLPIFKE